MLDLVKKYALRPEQIEKIECLVPYSTTKLLFHTNPGNKLEAKFSMNFVMAAGLTDHKVGLDQVTDEKLNDPAIRDLLGMVVMRAYDGPEDRPVTVTVRLKDGNEYSDSAMNPRGHAEMPLSRDDLLDKYTDCAKRVLDEDAIERSISLLDEMEKLPDIKELMEIVRTG
jgi:2-methylcitrate dehydratase PrpD